MIDFNRYEFLDFGCSDGGSINWAKKFFKIDGRGLGIDISSDKVAVARERGFDAEVFDIDELPNKAVVEFVTMMHFLEHLQGFGQAARYVEKACRVASSFVVIRQPFFDADHQLLERGLKCHWSDWTGHTFTMSSLQMVRVCNAVVRKGLMSAFLVGGFKKITDSSDLAVVSIDAPKDVTVRDLDGWAEKKIGPPKQFDFPVYRELVCVIAKNPEACEKFGAALPVHHVIYKNYP